MRKKKKPSPRVPRQERAQTTYTSILEATERILRTEGLGKLSTNRIAKIAGVSIGSVYQYFPDKKAILKLAGESYGEKYRARFRAHVEAAKATNLKAALRALLDGVVHAHRFDPRTHAAIAEIRAGQPPVKDRGPYYDYFATTLAAHRSEIRRRDPEIYVHAVFQTLDALAHVITERRVPGGDEKKYADEIVRMVHAYLTVKM
ncbi:MAG: TetR/AcrR family transcriptional regulator [Bdellovibrionaceae bacterium]|nr:TetR/AcrR family transcriptional regulator [Pseudobdellovibrionaceae bacterium]